MEVVPLANRPAENLLPLLLPFLEENERAVANGSDLVLKSSPGRMEELKALIRTLDTGPRGLVVTVIQGSDTSAEELNAQARLHVNIPLDAPEQTRGAIHGRYYSTQRDDRLENKQRIRTLEGTAAIIKTGRTIPYQNFGPFGPDPYGYGPSSTEFLEVTTGFSVIPRFAGNHQVILEISPWSERFGNGFVESRNAQSTIRAALGEWVEIGGHDQISRMDQKGLLSRRYQSDTRRDRILIKVDDLPD